MLSGLRILDLVRTRQIIIEPFHPSQLNPNSYNLRLGPKLLVYENRTLIAGGDNPTTEIEIENGFRLQPGVVYLGSTIEYTETKNHVPCLEGRSSVGRLGLQVHSTAGFGDIGFCGHWTLELSVVQPVRVFVGMEICQIAYHLIEGDFERYRGRYQDQGSAPVASRL